VSRTTVYRWRTGDTTPSVHAVRSVTDLHEARWTETRKRIRAIRSQIGFMERVESVDMDMNGKGG